MSGFIYIWFDRKHKRYYIGSHWGTEDDGYICSSNWMRTSYKRRPQDFKRRIIKRIDTSRIDLLTEENRYLSMIKQEEMKPKNSSPRYYNLNTKTWKNWHNDDETRKTIGQKISASKKGKKTGPRDPSIGEAISKAKRESFARRQAELGYKFTPEHAANNKSAQYKRYLITMSNGDMVEVYGLKKYAEERGIPYISLARASQKGSSVSKYGIREVSALYK